jgi:uncharacterized membrane protein
MHAVKAAVGYSMTALASSHVNASAHATSQDGNIVYGHLYDGSEIVATRWEGNGQSFLPDLGQGSSASASSSDGRYTGGRVWFTGSDSLAAYWDNGSLGLPRLANGEVAYGLIQAITDSGIMVGTSQYGAFIFQTGWTHARRFDEWLATEHKIVIENDIAAVHDVYSADSCNVYFVLTDASPGSDAFVLRVPNKFSAKSVEAVPTNPIPSPTPTPDGNIFAPVQGVALGESSSARCSTHEPAATSSESQAAIVERQSAGASFPAKARTAQPVEGPITLSAIVDLEVLDLSWRT